MEIIIEFESNRIHLGIEAIPFYNTLFLLGICPTDPSVSLLWNVIVFFATILRIGLHVLVDQMEVIRKSKTFSS